MERSLRADQGVLPECGGLERDGAGGGRGQPAAGGGVGEGGDGDPELLLGAHPEGADSPHGAQAWGARREIRGLRGGGADRVLRRAGEAGGDDGVAACQDHLYVCCGQGGLRPRRYPPHQGRAAQKDRRLPAGATSPARQRQRHRSQQYGGLAALLCPLGLRALLRVGRRRHRGVVQCLFRETGRVRKVRPDRRCRCGVLLQISPPVPINDHLRLCLLAGVLVPEAVAHLRCLCPPYSVPLNLRSSI
mmetsp:Transcript_45569/g.120412  ORF Transcript_45569/g.120412 Transcript_45569/m.120412 type:complete len:247 (-) Transcript_45569:1278-2018(-)